MRSGLLVHRGGGDLPFRDARPYEAPPRPKPSDPVFRPGLSRMIPSCRFTPGGVATSGFCSSERVSGHRSPRGSRRQPTSLGFPLFHDDVVIDATGSETSPSLARASTTRFSSSPLPASRLGDRSMVLGGEPPGSRSHPSRTGELVDLGTSGKRILFALRVLPIGRSRWKTNLGTAQRWTRRVGENAMATSERRGPAPSDLHRAVRGPDFQVHRPFPSN